MSTPFLPPWLDPNSPQYGRLDPTGQQAARFILSVAKLPKQETYTPEEVALARRTLAGHVPPFEIGASK